MSKKSSKKKTKNKYKTRREYTLSQFPDYILDMWYKGDEKELNEFADFIISQEDTVRQDSMSSIFEGDNIYQKKIKDLKCKQHDSINDLLIDMEKIRILNKKIRKNKSYSKIYKKKDLGIASYLDSSRYSKKYLNKSKYRKELKKIAKTERNEIKEMRKLGYIKNPNVDEELQKLKKANKLMSNALSDAYTQKHFL